MKKLLLILVLSLFASCGDNITHNSKPVEKKVAEKDDIVEQKFAGTFHIGGLFVKMLRDERNLVDVITSYVYVRNSDGSDGRVYLSKTDNFVVGDTISWVDKITPTLLNSRLENVLADSGAPLSPETHTLTVNIWHLEKLGISLQLRNAAGKIIMIKLLKEE